MIVSVVAVTELLSGALIVTLECCDRPPSSSYSIMKIQDCVALVTGSNRGLGLAYCEGLLGAGAAKVYAAARDPSIVIRSVDTLVQ